MTNYKRKVKELEYIMDLLTEVYYSTGTFKGGYCSVNDLQKRVLYLIGQFRVIRWNKE